MKRSQCLYLVLRLLDLMLFHVIEKLFGKDFALYKIMMKIILGIIKIIQTENALLKCLELK